MHKIYPWQKQQWQYLLSCYRQDNIPHALLFSGAEGLGKLDFAKTFAELLLCKNNSPESNFACGHCSACKLIAVNNHPDLLIIQPEKEGGMIKIDQIRSLIADLDNTAQQGGYQVAIISPANSMNISAANALLKTLEEPLGEKTIIILLSDKPTMLPATIRSRCQFLAFGAPNALEAQKWLQELTLTSKNKTNSHDNAINLILNFTQGAPLQALSLLEDQQMQSYIKLRQEIIAVMQKEIHAINFAAEHTDDDLRLIIAIFLSFIMDITRLYFDLPEKFISNQDKVVALKAFSKVVSLRNVFMFWDELLQLNKMLYEHTNFNRQLMLESLCLKCRDSLS